MKKQLLKRSEVRIEHTWNIDNIYPNESVYVDTFDQLENVVKTFCQTFEGKLNQPNILSKAVTEYQDIQAHMVRLSAYSGLQSSVDSLSESTQLRHGKAMMRFQKMSKELTFFSNELKHCDDTILLEASKLDADNTLFFLEVIEEKNIC